MHEARRPDPFKKQANIPVWVPYLLLLAALVGCLLYVFLSPGNIGGHNDQALPNPVCSTGNC